MYNYQTLKPKMYTDEGIKLLLKIQRRIIQLAQYSNKVTLEDIIHGICGDNWTNMAAVDYLCETGQIHKISGNYAFTQHQEYYIR